MRRCYKAHLHIVRRVVQEKGDMHVVQPRDHHPWESEILEFDEYLREDLICRKMEAGKLDAHLLEKEDAPISETDQ